MPETVQFTLTEKAAQTSKLSTNTTSLSLISPSRLISQCLRSWEGKVCSLWTWFFALPSVIYGLCWALNFRASSSPSRSHNPTLYCSRPQALDSSPQARFHFLVSLSNPHQNIISASCHLGNTRSSKSSPSNTHSSDL